MLRKISIIPIILAMMMVMMTTVVPHHHHQAMICMVKEICEADGCCDDEHTQHSDPNQNEEESHCVAHEQYSPSENLKVDEAAFSGIVTDITPILAELADQGFAGLEASEYAFGGFIPEIPPPPPLSSAASNAPPRNA